MLDRPLITHEIGSLSKPSWRVKALSGKELHDADREDAKRWGNQLDIPNREKLFSLLEKNHFSSEEKQQIQNFSSLYAIKFLESTGLDLIWDGEQHRIEMYEYPIQNISGMHFEGHVRSFDNKYYRKASCQNVPRCEIPYHLDEFRYISKNTSKNIKIPVTGAYTLADWSYDAYYKKHLIPGEATLHIRSQAAREHFVSAIAANVIHPNLKALVDAGARYLQIDEPAATTKRDEIDLFLKGLKESIGDLSRSAFFSIHVCYSHYERLFPTFDALDDIVDAIHLEYANRDSRNLGTTKKERTGYETLKNFQKMSCAVGLGVIDIHRDFIEPPELIRDRILYACDVIENPYRIMVAPDCGLRTRTWDVAYRKLCAMVEGRNLALQTLF